MVICEKCGKPCDFEDTATHDRIGPGRSVGMIYIRAYCHGETADIAITFAQAESNMHRKIVVFGVSLMDKIRARPMIEVISFLEWKKFLETPSLAYTGES